MKIINLIGIIALIYLLANWWFTGDRPNDWFIAVLLILYLIEKITELIFGDK